MKELSFAPKLIQLQFIRDNALIIIKYQLMTLWFNNTYEKKKHKEEILYMIYVLISIN